MFTFVKICCLDTLRVLCFVVFNATAHSGFKNTMSFLIYLHTSAENNLCLITAMLIQRHITLLLERYCIIVVYIIIILHISSSTLAFYCFQFSQFQFLIWKICEKLLLLITTGAPPCKKDTASLSLSMFAAKIELILANEAQRFAQLFL